jgi:hypothetical protein
MVKTQIQLPDHLFREAKRIAAEYEMSFAEVVRRSLERTMPGYPPEPLDLGPVLAPVEDWRLLANEQPPEISTPSRRRRSKPSSRQ